MWGLIAGFVIATILMVIEYLLCVKLKNPLWGGILPLILIVGTVYVFMGGIMKPNLDSLYPFVILNTLMLSDWISGREKYKKNRKAELDKMMAHDIER